MARSRTTTAQRQKTVQDTSARVRNDLSRLIVNPEKGKLRWWFDVGHLVLLLHPRPEPGAKRHYGQKTTLKLAQQFRPDDATKAKSMSGMLVQARKLALRFDDWDKLAKFQGNLSIWHAMSLLAVDRAKASKSTMEQMHRRCVAEGWSVEKLKREIQIDKGGKMASGRRPKPLPAVTSAIAVKDLITAARRWRTYHDECLAGRRPILEHAHRTDYSDHLLRDVQNAIQGLEQVRDAVTDELQQLRQLAKNIAARKE